MSYNKRFWQHQTDLVQAINKTCKIHQMYEKSYRANLLLPSGSAHYLVVCLQAWVERGWFQTKNQMVLVKKRTVKCGFVLIWWVLEGS